MARLERLIDHLPSLYRPQPGDESLLLDLLAQWGSELDSVSDLMTDVMQAHWHGFADKALYSPYLNRDRQQRQLEPISPASTDLEERQLLNEFPYINDLARLGSLVDLPVWREPSELRESVENYRLRLQKTFEIYRNGLGTLDAVRAIVETNLPLNMAVPLYLRHRSFSVEEYSPYALHRQEVIARGAPTEYVGPLMRWDLQNESITPVQPTVYIQGVTPENDKFSATTNPIIERLSSDGITGVGLVYSGTVAPTSVLRIAPIPITYIASGGDVLQSFGEPDQQVALSAWQTMVEQVGNEIKLLCQSVDHTLWAAVDNAGTSELWRYRGNGWLRVLDGFAFDNIVMLKTFENDLYLGDSNGLHLISCLPEIEDDYLLESSDLFSDSVFDMYFDGSLFWFATSSGVFTVAQGGTDVSATPIQSATYCIATLTGASHTLYFGGELGVFHYHLTYDRWTILVASSASDLVVDWQSFDAATPPVTFLPPVHALTIDTNSSLWMATEQGLARYFCYSSGEVGLTYTTQLQAFPDIIQGAVHQVKLDVSGQLWCCGDTGLFRFDGRDFHQYLGTENVWQPLGAAALLYPNDVDSENRGRWRFNNALLSPVWEQFHRRSGAWMESSLALRSIASIAVHTFFWSHSIKATLGTWDADTFLADTSVPTSDFSMRVKRSATQIIGGGLVALPRLEKGQSTWRYLSRELDPPHVPVQTPWWSTEGRLAPSPDDEVAPYPGRFRAATPEPADPALPAGRYDEVVFAYLPSAKVSFRWAEKKPFSLLVRLSQRQRDEVIHPAILDRVWQGIQKVKPAGAHVFLAVEQLIVRGEEQ
jgi:hypothetical protein